MHPCARVCSTAQVDLIDACYHYTNVPVVFGKERVVVSCTMSIDGVWAEVYVADPGCGVCTTYEEWCMIGGEATMDIHVQGTMARETGGGGDVQTGRNSEGGINGRGAVEDAETGDSRPSPPAAGASDTALAAAASSINGGGNSSEALRARSRQMRAQIRLGWPLQGYERCSTAVCRAEQEAKVSVWATSTLEPLLEGLRAEEPKGVQLDYEFAPITRRAMAGVLTSDLILAGMPLAVGFVYLWLYTSSLALALAGVLQLAFAWPCALFFYRYVFGLQHVENLTLLAAPLTAAFSLDAMALLVDAWHSSTVQPVRDKGSCAVLARSQSHRFLLAAAGSCPLLAARAPQLGDPRGGRCRASLDRCRRCCIRRWWTVAVAERRAPRTILRDTADSAACLRVDVAARLPRALP